jgi:hypothetical protein
MAKKKPSIKAKRNQPLKREASLSLSERAMAIFQQEIRQGPLQVKVGAEFGEAEGLLCDFRADID